MPEPDTALVHPMASAVRPREVPVTALPTRVVGEKYVIERRLAEGGMGTLYVARHSLTTQRVALKLLDPRLARDDASLERFMREVRVAARIAHPGVVRVFDAGVDVDADGVRVPFLAMELLTGETLAERLGRGNVPQSDAIDRLVATLDPLVAAHAMGFVHRDLKPENLFLERLEAGGERVKLLDFGIARDTADAQHATLDGQYLGTVYYMAPEQCLDARRATPAADVWSFGVMLYQCLAGVFPFDGETVTTVMLAACRDPHRPLAERRPDLDPRLSALIERCLAKSPAERPAHAEALRAELVPLVCDPVIRASLAQHPVDPWSYLGDAAAAPMQRSGVSMSAPPLVVESSASWLDVATASTAPARSRPPAEPTLPPSAPAESPAATTPPPRRALTSLAVLALVAALVGGIVVIRTRSRATTRPPVVATIARPAPPVVTPVAPAPVVAEPIVAEPVVAEPVVAEPVVAEPVVAEPVVANTLPRTRSARSHTAVVTAPPAAEPVVAEPAPPAPPAPTPEPAPPVLLPEPPPPQVAVAPVRAPVAPPPPRVAPTAPTTPPHPTTPAAPATTTPDFVTF
jgi:serine/threonine-protein kinase